MAATVTVAAEIRKLRKKLRQIENLERLARPLDDLEQLKVSKKYDIRERLQELLDQEDSNPLTPHQEEQHAQSPLPSQPLSSSAASMDKEERVEGGDGGDRRETMDHELAGNTVVQEEDDKMKERSEVKQVPSNVKKTDQLKSQQTSEQSPKTSTKKQKKGNTEKAQNKQWEKVSVVVSELDGHSDLVTSIAVQGTTLVSGSRDTTVKIWDLQTREETYSLGGHTETVTSVLILSPGETAFLNDGSEVTEDSWVVSGSTDCTIRLWSLKSGRFLKSVYTFNPVTCVDYCYSLHLLVTASDGGKIELWNLKTAENVCTVRAHEESVTGIKVINNTVITSDSQGLVMVHEIRGTSLMRIFVSEDVRASGSGKVTQRTIRSLTAVGHMIIYGDDAPNLKLLDWKKGLVSKVVNHDSEFASTDAVCVWDDLLLTSSYDLDTGSGYINVRSVPTWEYLGSVDDEAVEGTERIMCLTATRLTTGSGNKVIVSGGPQLKVWELLLPGKRGPEGTHEQWVTVTQFRPKLAQPAEDSEAESDLNDDDDDDDSQDDNDDDVRRRCEDGDDQEDTGWTSWCSIV